ncbi:general negative regulator of transcription subunit 5 [Coemansia asiatica]|uniref:General negative regulator of transcription subunit n=1 Tax=Coemansia asiatica TaxID=1052880 RepID=A0A9W8CLW8_9FUNG|nr:general negative regulator of transcription subunit 5 [Coemansia asiatica]KAJ2888542.1 general negative regulator of transcription subunit 5 [Coemansia asiatica]
MSRKVQAEIERVFKKVAEGIEEFEDCYDKVLNASNASQKEKYETDLKKEIKKLQRLRDQIKTWIQSNDIKDKQDLLHHRKLIEKQMEKFKAIEKEMKTKAYSKEGLLQSTKLDPKEKEKIDLCNWLVESVDTLSTQIDVLEATAETLEGSMGKKRRDASKVEKLNRLHERVDRHKHHIWCLERIQRLLENESLSTEQVQRIQEDVNYYVEQNDDEEFIEDEFIYDELPLNDDDGLFTIPGEEETNRNESRNDSDSDDETDHNDADDGRSVDGRETLSQSSIAEPLSTGRLLHSSKGTGTGTGAGPNKQGVLGSVLSASSTGSATIVIPQSSTLSPAPVESRNAWSEVKESVLSPSRPGTTTGISATQTLPPPPSSTLAQPWASIASHALAASAQSTTLKQSSAADSSADLLSRTPAPAVAASSSATQVALVSPSTKATEAAAAASSAKTAMENGLSVTETQAVKKSPAAQTPEAQQSPVPTKMPLPRASTSPVGTKRTSVDDQNRASMQRPKYFTLFQDNDVPDAFADLMATFMKAKSQYMSKKETSHSAQRQMVDMGLLGIPSLLDQERPKRNAHTPVNTPSYYPQTALPVIEHPGMASHLDLDTLFFAFYYQPDTYQQYLAAKELNRQSWRFHKKYLTWFQRYEEPSDITDDYEQGTYLYFDYEGAWCQRKKSEFRFEYQFLEDTELA